MATWRFILTELDGTEVGELWQARGRVVDLPLNGLPTIAGSVDLDNPMVDTILGATALQRINLLVKAYRDGTLVFVGPFTSGEESGDESGAGGLSFGAGGPLWRLNSRLVGKAPNDLVGIPPGYGDGTPLEPKDLGQIAKGMIDVANAEVDTGIRVGAIVASTASFVGPWHYKKIGEAIAEIGPGTLGGFDFEIEPIEPDDDVGGVAIGTFKAYAVLGSFKPAVFEYGVGRRNVTSYRRPITAEGQANRVHSLPPGYPDAIPIGHSVQVSANAEAIAARGLFEDVLGVDLQPDDMRLALGNEHVAIRKQPREQVIFTPARNATPDYGTDYRVGDVVTARAVVNGRTRFDAAFRIYGVKFTIGDDGTEQIDLTLISEAA